MPVADALEHLVGMQAQEPWDPYYALWSRLDGFDPDELGGMIERFEAVRMGVMRGTIHLMTARDALVLRGVMGPVMSGTYRSSMFSRQVEGVDVDELLGDRGGADGREATRAHRPFASALGEVAGRGLRRARLHGDVSAAARAGSPARGVGEDEGGEVAERGEGAGRARWSGTPTPARSCSATCARSGPAASKDVRAWCYRTGLREVIDGLRPQLRVYRTEDGAELYDVEDGLFPDPETPAPVRFLPEYDNAVLGFADRSQDQAARRGRAPVLEGRRAGRRVRDGDVELLPRQEERRDRDRRLAQAHASRARGGRGGSRGAARVGRPGGRGPSAFGSSSVPRRGRDGLHQCRISHPGRTAELMLAHKGIEAERVEIPRVAAPH